MKPTLIDVATRTAGMAEGKKGKAPSDEELFKMSPNQLRGAVKEKEAEESEAKKKGYGYLKARMNISEGARTTKDRDDEVNREYDESIRKTGRPIEDSAGKSKLYSHPSSKSMDD